MDPSYEFIAPQFVDFTSMDPDGDGDEDKFFDVKNETAEEEVLGYLTARDGELTEGAIEEEQEDEEEEVDIIEATEGDNRKKSGTDLQYSTLEFQSSNNSDNEENGSSNEVKFTCAVYQDAPSNQYCRLKIRFIFIRHQPAGARHHRGESLSIRC